jgi:hypothetical protein
MRCLWLAVTLGTILAAPARAEQIGAPRFEIGGTLSGVVPVHLADGPAIVASVGPRISVPVLPRLRVEALVEAMGPGESAAGALYETQLRLAVRKSPDRGRVISLTVGAAGAALYERVRERRDVRPDQSTVVYPGYQRFRVTAPSAFTVGVVRDQVLARHISGSLGLQGYFSRLGGVALRISLGLSFGVGGRR